MYVCMVIYQRRISGFAIVRADFPIVMISAVAGQIIILCPVSVYWSFVRLWIYLGVSK